MKKEYLLCLSNGLSYDDSDYECLVVADDKSKLLAWMDSHPINAKMYKSIFHYDLQSYMLPQYEIKEVYRIE